MNEAKNYRMNRMPRYVVGFALITILSTGAQSQLLEEVVVTAQKREQSIQDVGISITAFSGDQMNKLNMTESNDLVAMTPGLEVSGFGGGALASFNIRGVGQNDFTANQEAPVATYIDEAYQASNITTRFALFDLERSEVLRGPQGTLFGRNSTGGLVHFITAKPTQETEGFFDISLGEEGRRRLEAAVSGSLTDKAAGRISAVYNEDDGLLENDMGADARMADDWALRGQLLLDPSEELNILLKAQYAEEDGAPSGWSFDLPSFNPTDFYGYVDADGDPFTISSDYDFSQASEILNLYAKMVWDFGIYTLTSVTDYQDIEHSYTEDADASPTDIYNYDQSVDIDQFSQELRINWEGESHRSVVGLYYLSIDGDFVTDQSGAAFFGDLIYRVNAYQETTTYAIFGQTEFDLTDQLSVTAGLRYTDDDKDYTLVSADFGYPAFTANLSDDDISAKLQLNYRVNDDWLVYGGWSRGIKSGGFNFPLTPDPTATATLPYGGEVLNSLEIGFKANLSDAVRLNVSAYTYDYNDYQAYNIDPYFNTLLFNADAEFSGAEVELYVSTPAGLDIILGASFSDTEVTELPTDFNTLDPITFAPAQNYPTGEEEAPLNPSTTINGLVRYSWVAFNGQLAMQADFRWVDDHKFNLAVSELASEESYTVLNARLDYTTADERWNAAIFVNNLTDEEYRTFGVDASLFFGSAESVYGAQRWFGASVRYSF